MRNPTRVRYDGVFHLATMTMLVSSIGLSPQNIGLGVAGGGGEREGGVVEGQYRTLSQSHI